jgi:hypothetical protein
MVARGAYLIYQTFSYCYSWTRRVVPTRKIIPRSDSMVKEKNGSPQSQKGSYDFNEICFAIFLFTLELQQKTDPISRLVLPSLSLATSGLR